MSENDSEFFAPSYSVIERRAEGMQIIASIILDGEIAEFVVDRATVQAGKNLESPKA